jgi:hypothetical protein
MSARRSAGPADPTRRRRGEQLEGQGRQRPLHPSFPRSSLETYSCSFCACEVLGCSVYIRQGMKELLRQGICVLNNNRGLTIGINIVEGQYI